MPIRKVILATDEYYHIYSRGVDGRPIFLDQNDYQRFLDTLGHYHFREVPVKFSQREAAADIEMTTRMSDQVALVGLVAYCLMPNHFHLLLQQQDEAGISTFMQRILCSHTSYFNRKHERNGTLFQRRFQAVHVGTNDQLLHLSRYIHLNPYAAGLVERVEEYPFSSFPSYLQKTDQNLAAGIVLNQFSSPADYDRFVQDQKDYSRELKKIRKLLLEEKF